MTSDIFSLITELQLSQSKGITFSDLRSITLNQNETFKFPASNLSKYVIYINVAYATPNNTVTFYDRAGAVVFTYNIIQPISISLEYVNYTQIQFSEAVDTANYEIGIFYSIVTFKNEADYNNVMPKVLIQPNLPDVATNAEIIELQTLINTLNADTATGLKDLAEIINTQTSQLASMESNPYGVFVNNFPQQTLSPTFAEFTTADSTSVNLNLPDTAHYVIIQNLSSTSINIGNSTAQPFVLSPMGIFEWSSDNNGIIINPSEISAIGSSGLKLAIMLV